MEKRKAEEDAAAQAASAGAGAAKGKGDPKKDAKGGAKGAPKGGPAGDDKNAPQAITVEYPEIDSDKNYIVYERQFDQQPGAAITRKPPRSAGPLVGKSSSKDPWGNMSDKFKDRSKELISKYKITRGSAYSLAVKLRLNLDEETEPEPEVIEEPVVVDPKKGGKK